MIELAGTGMTQLFCFGELPEPHVQITVWSGPSDELATTTGVTNRRDADGGTAFEGELETARDLLVPGSPTGATTDPRSAADELIWTHAALFSQLSMSR